MMKLHFQVFFPDGSISDRFTITQDIKLGRDPDSPLSLSGDAAKGVSWEHAAIEFSSDRVILKDLGSSNGTWIAGQKIFTPVQLSEKMEFSLGATGPKIRIESIEIRVTTTELKAVPSNSSRAEPIANPTPPPLSQSPYAKYLLLIPGLLVVVVLVLVMNKSNKPIETVSKDPASIAKETIVADANKSVELLPKTTPDNLPKEKTKVSEVSPKKIPDLRRKERAPSVAVQKEIGIFVSTSKEVPPVLLQGVPNSDAAWVRLQDGDAVLTNQTLVSLPGYRSGITLNNKTNLILWGHLPDFGDAGIPVFESAIILNTPDRPGVDVDFILDRGRLQIFGRKEKTVVRLQFAQQEALIELPDVKSSVVLELSFTGNQLSAAGELATEAYLGIFAFGDLKLRPRNGDEISLPAKSLTVWPAKEKRPMAPKQLQEPPIWMKKELISPGMAEEERKQLLSVLSGLTDWSKKYFAKVDSIVDIIKTQLTERPALSEEQLRLQGLLFYAAIDEIGFVVRYLEDKGQSADDLPKVRNTAATAIRHWVRTKPEQLRRLRQLFAAEKFPKEKSDLIVRLLVAPEQGENGSFTKEELLKQLSHESLMVRQLAYQRLIAESRMKLQGDSEKLKQIGYDPSLPEEERKAAIERWKQLLR